MPEEISRRKKFNTDNLIQEISEHFKGLPKLERAQISTHDCAMAGMMIMGLKSASFLQFEERIKETRLHQNLLKLYNVSQVPKDSTFRVRMDQIDTQELRKPFKTIFAKLQRGNILKQYRYLENYYFVSLDGTGFYSSQAICGDCCCVKNHRDGTQTYYHQCLSGVLIHPDIKQVIPFMPEFICKQDGAAKNDCERNASKRFLQDLRREHPHLKIAIVEDGLASNGPHLKLLEALDMKYITVAKEADHKFLFDWFKHAEQTHMTVIEDDDIHEFCFANGIPLNDEHHDYKVNVLSYRCGKTKYTWVTNFTITKENAYQIMRGGRARWKIENETFNTLKNQGYEFEHNFGHGNAYLANNMAVFMMLAFLIDQIQMLVNNLFQAARKHLRTWKQLWEDIRALMRYFIFDSWDQIYSKIAFDTMNTT